MGWLVFGPWFGFVLLGSMNTSPHFSLVGHPWSWFLFFFLTVTFPGCMSSTSKETTKTMATPSQSKPDLGYRSNPRTVQYAHKSKCQTSATLALSATRTSILVSYEEPTKRADGRPLTDLVKTTIYFDVGKGWVKAKDIPSSGPEGGGTISETVPLPSGKRTSPTIQVCVTATDSRGLEG